MGYDYEARVGTRLPLYLITEAVETTSVGMPSKVGIGPQITQVYRHVGQFIRPERIYYRGKPVQGVPSAAQYIAEFFMPGKQLTTQPTGEQAVLVLYAGTRTLAAPLPRANIVPKWASKNYDVSKLFVPTPWGEDPFPDQQLFGNQSIKFVMKGGQGIAIALALYDATTDTLKQPPVDRTPQYIDELLKQVQQQRKDLPVEQASD